MQKQPKSIVLLTLKNPFNLDDKRIDIVPIQEGKSVYHYAAHLMLPPEELAIVVNGRELDVTEYQSYCPMPGDYIAMCPAIGGGDDGKAVGRILGYIAAGLLAVATGAWIAGAGFSVGAGFATIGSWGFGATLGAAAAWGAGKWLVDWIFPKGDKSDQERGQYSWSALRTLTGVGNAVPLTYGTTRIGGQIVSQHIVSSGSKQYLELLLCGGEGPCDYIGNGEDDNCIGISDIEINGNPIENLEDVQIYKRAGLNDQSVIPEFSGVYEDQHVGVELTKDGEWHTYTTAGDGGSAIEVTLHFPMGLFRVTDKGDRKTTSVTFQIQYSPHGENNWTSYPDYLRYKCSSTSSMIYVDGDVRTVFPVGTRVQIYQGGRYRNATVTSVTYSSSPSSSYTQIRVDIPLNKPTYIRKERDTITISDNKKDGFRLVYRLHCGKPGKYDVRCRCVSKDGTSEKYYNTIFWESFSHISFEDFARPNKVLLGIKALATNQLSGGVPNVTWLQTRSKVWVWNPYTNKYEQKPANNPAWAAYDIIHRANRLYDVRDKSWKFYVRGVAKERMDYQAFADWADFCDWIVPGTGKKRCEFNYWFSSTTTLWDALGIIEAVGRGKVLIKGTRFSPIFDGVSEPVHLFTMSNIIKDSFQEKFISMEERASAIEVTFQNKDKGYQADTFTVYMDNYEDIATNKVTPVSVEMPGITSFEQAYREAKYRLRLSKYLTRIISFSAAVDAIPCQVGDVILFQHDVTRWGVGGRVIEATENSVQLDKVVTLQAHTPYQITVRTPTGKIETREIEVSPTTVETDILLLKEPWQEIPLPDAVYSFGELHISAKPFRVINITRDQDFTRQLTCMEYIDEVYMETDDIPQIDYTGYYDVSAPGELTLRQRTEGDRVYLDATWHPIRANQLKEIRIYLDNELIGTAPGLATNYSIEVTELKSYHVEIRAIDSNGKVLVTKDAYFNVETDILLPDTPVISHVSMAKSGARIVWAGNAYRYNVYRKDGNYPHDSSGAELVGSTYDIQFLDTSTKPGSQYTWYVSAVDVAWNESPLSEGIVKITPEEVVVTTPPDPLVDVVVVFDEDELKPDRQSIYSVTVSFGISLIPEDQKRAYIQVKYKLADEIVYRLGDRIIPSESGVATASISGLMPDTEYEIALVPVSGYGIEGVPKVVTHKTMADNIPPAKPVVSYRWDGRNIHVFWNEVTTAANGRIAYDIAGYEVRRDTNFGVDDENRIYYGPNLECTDNERPTSRNFSLYVAAVDRFNNYSEITTLSINIPPPMAPPAPEIQEFFSGLKVRVFAVTDPYIVSYNIHLTPCDNNGLPTGEPVIVLCEPFPGECFYEAQSGSSFLVQVAACDILGEGEKTGPILATARFLQEVEIPDGLLDQSKLTQSLAQKIDSVDELSSEIQRLNDEITLKVQYNADGKMIVTGIGVASGPEGGEVAVMADRFRVFSSTTETGEGKPVFVVDSQTKAVYLVGDLIADGTITARMINTEELVTKLASIKDAYIDSANIISVDASKIKVGGSSAPIPLAIQPGDTLFRFDGSLLSTQGLKPLGME